MKAISKTCSRRFSKAGITSARWAAPQPTASAPQPTASAPLSGGPENPWSASAYAPGDTVKAGNKSYTVEKLIASGSEGDIYIVNGGGRRYALKLFHSGYKANTKVLPALEKLKGKGYIADIIAILLTGWTVLDIVRSHNLLTMRKLPQFGKRGGDEHEY